MLRILMDGRGRAAWNMALDEALLHLVEVPVLRLYGWEGSPVSVGYFQDVGIVPSGREYVRRFTGGGYVDHAADATYSVVLPREHPMARVGTAQSYRQMHAAVARALGHCGVACRLAAETAEAAGLECFRQPVPFDVVAPGGVKLAGAAQRRNRHGVLVQGSVLVSPMPADLRVQLAQELSGLLGGGLASETTAAEMARARELEAEKYGTPDWNDHRRTNAARD